MNSIDPNLFDAATIIIGLFLAGCIALWLDETLFK